MKKYELFKQRILLITLLSFVEISSLFSQNIQNPVLPHVADAGVIKYNGKYYIGGVFTDGSYYISDDLVKWTGPVHVLDMNNDWTTGTGAGNDQIHANDMLYLNGKFHLYWSVNYWGKDKHIVHIAHAEANDILGPYIEPVKSTWMDNRIDPKVFKDDDGKLYMYMVRFTDGNTIWVRPMKDPSTFSGAPVYQFASLPQTWETMDNRVAEGPWVMKYRNRYYMMYNANHTATEWGNYQLGVAEADSPTSFNHGTKYPYPLLLSNQTKVDEEYVDLLQFKKTYNPLFSYTTTLPQGDWKSPSFDDSAWQKGIGGFASEKIEGSTARKQGTVWNTETIYLRKSFTANKSDIGNLALRVTHDGDTKIYLNGHLIYDKSGVDYKMINLSEKEKSALKDGDNCLAVESKSGKENYVNVSLFDMKSDKADDILFSPGQPNILRGLNGFEWWLIYMANKNKEVRSQYVNRIHFFDKTMHSDGITSSNTEGYFSEPTKPTYGDTFDDDKQSKNKWLFSDKEWIVTNGEFISNEQISQTAVLEKTFEATDYYFEAGVNTTDKAGVVAWWKDKDNWLKVGFDSSNKSWYYQMNVNGAIDTKSYLLPADFKFGVYHTITVQRNSQIFSINIDEIPAPQLPLIKTTILDKGVPGLFSEKGKSSFDGLIYTIGWDEFDTHIGSWKDSRSGEKAIGKYNVSGKGLEVLDNKFQAFKGDFLSQYEFSTQITNSSDNGTAGIYPVFIDKDNYVKAVFDYNRQKLIVTRVVKGKIVLQNDYALDKWQTHYADIKYTDFIEKGYSFATPTWIEAIRLSRQAFYNENVFIDNMFDKVSAEYLKDGEWHSFTNAENGVAEHPAYNQMSFDKVKAEGLRFINKDATDQNSYLYKIRVKEQFKDSYNLRCVKLKDTLLIFVDGKEVCRVKASATPAQVGLFSENCLPIYNGIMRYHIPE